MKLTLLSLLIAGLALSGCDQKATNSSSTSVQNGTVSQLPVSTTPAVNKEDAVAIVNGQYIPKSALDELEREIAIRSHGQSFPKEKLVEELIQRELLIQDANQKHLEQTPDFIAHLAEAKKALLSQADLQNFMSTNPVTDEEVKKEYDSKIASESGTEYKARHILVKTEAEAKKIIADLDKGADFSKLANKVSLDGKESQNGGDLGWFSAAQMVAPFSQAVESLENGKYSKTPVQTQFGYHVVLREDSRPITPPPLDAVKDQLTPFLQRQKIQTMLENLRKSAKVEVLLSPEKVEAPATVESVQPTTESAPAENSSPEASTPPQEKTSQEKP